MISRLRPRPWLTPAPVWNIPKLRYYEPTPGTPPTQRLWAPNGDERLVLSADGLTVSNAGGYRTARAAFGLAEGTSYFEVVVPSEGSVRLGWSLARGDVEAPVGYDKWSFAMRAADGYRFHDSRGRSYGTPCVAGDVVGALVHLPPRPADEPDPQPPVRELPCAAIVAETDTYWSVRILPDTPCSLPTSERVPVPRRGSFIAFYCNGAPLGVAFHDLWAGVYYPAVSPFRTSVTAHFGPHLRAPPTSTPSDVAWIPASSLALPHGGASSELASASVAAQHTPM